MGALRPFVLPALVLLLAPPVLAQRPVAMPELLGRVRLAALRAAGERKVRLGVAAFQPVEAQRALDLGFSGYLTEQVFGGLAAAGPSLRLFERARLDAVLKEQKLASSGLFDESEARRIGELAPIDLLLTGTWTRLEGGVALQGRFLDVVSGEVVATFAETLEVGRDLAGLFGSPGARVGKGEAGAGAEEADPCAGPKATLDTRMQDLRDPAQVEALVEAALQVPFQGPCGQLHLGVLGTLVRHRLPSPRYAHFLQGQLEVLADPDQDRRTGAMVTYLRLEGRLDEGAWTAVAELAARSRRPWQFYEALLGEPRVDRAAELRLRTRVATLLAMAEAGRIGRPTAQAPGEVAMALLRTLQGLYQQGRQGREAHPEPVLDFLRLHGRRIPVGERDLLGALESLVRSLAPGPQRDEALDLLAARMVAFPEGRAVPDLLNSFFQPRFRELDQRRAKGKSTADLDREHTRLVKAAGPRLAASLATFPDRETRLRLTRLLIQEGRKDPGLPTVEDLLEQLRDPAVSPRREAVQLLGAFGTRATPALPLVVRQLKRSLDGQERYLGADMLELLGHMGTRDPEAIGLLVQHLRSLETVLHESAQRGLSLVGAAAFPALREAWTACRPYEQIRMARIFQAAGTRAEVPWLKGRLKEATLSQLRDALEDALEAAEAR